MKIKGNFLKDYVKIVHDTPDLEWDKYLTEEDWEIVRGVIIPTAWYPVETMAHIGQGLFKMRSLESYESVRLHGRTRVDEILYPGTRQFLLKGDPVASIKAFAWVAKKYVDDLEIETAGFGPGFAELIFHPVDDAPAWDLFREIQAGTMEKLVELNGGKDARAEFIEDERDGREACIIKVTWKD